MCSRATNSLWQPTVYAEAKPFLTRDHCRRHSFLALYHISVIVCLSPSVYAVFMLRDIRLLLHEGEEVGNRNNGKYTNIIQLYESTALLMLSKSTVD